MHTHACPLYALTKLLGLDFTPDGLNLAPALPLTNFRFESPLLGLIKSARGYEGWYNPARRHSGIGYLSPIAYEAQMTKNTATT